MNQLADAPVDRDPMADVQLPGTLALVEDDADFARYLADHLRAQGIDVRVFHDGDAFLTSQGAFDFDFYILDLMLPGIDGEDLVRLIRRKGWAGVLVVSGRADPRVFDAVLQAGADMHLMKPVRLEQVALAISAIWRRVEAARTLADVWRLDRQARTLLTPDGVRVELSDTDLTLMECFVSAGNDVVTRATLCTRLGRDPEAEADNILHAAIYRLRRRIEQASRATVPLRAEPRVGYTFRGSLSAL